MHEDIDILHELDRMLHELAEDDGFIPEEQDNPADEDLDALVAAITSEE